MIEQGHGTAAEGNAALKAPRLTGLDPAYRWDAIVDSIEEVYRRVHAEHP